MVIVLSLAIIVFCSIVIWKVGDIFATSSSNIGDYLKLPRSVKGATFDAIASSFPELMVAVFSVLSFNKFEVGIGTIAGSALFNLLIIPGIAVLVAPKAFKVSKEIFNRDALFYLISVFALLVALSYSKIWGLGVPLIFILIYIWYLRDIVRDTKVHRLKKKLLNVKTFISKQSLSDKKVHLWKNIFIAFGTMLVMGIATYFLTQQAIVFSEAIGIPAIIISFTIIAAATSIPDTVVSVANARRGDIDDATSNVFGSNIFDILIGLSIPLLLAYFFTGPVTIVFNHMEIIFGLFGATILSLYFLRKYELKKIEGIFLLLLYAVFLVYIIKLSLVG